MEVGNRMNEQVDKPEAADEYTVDLVNLSKYELVMIASREARRLNDRARASGKELRRRVTDVAWERVQTGKVKYTYGELPYEEEPPLPLDEAILAEIPDIIEEDPPAKKTPAKSTPTVVDTAAADTTAAAPAAGDTGATDTTATDTAAKDTAAADTTDADTGTGDTAAVDTAAKDAPTGDAPAGDGSAEDAPRPVEEGA